LLPLIDIAGPDAGNIAKREAATATIAGKIIIRLYSQSRNDTIKKRCLDVIDRMIRVGSFMINETLDKFEGVAG
jgi:hypothetical protein